MGGYIANTNGVYSENFSGECVIVNLNLGNYYSMRDFASSLWEVLQTGADKDFIINKISENYKMEQEQVKREVGGFFEQLISEQLLIEQPLTVETISALDMSKFPAKYTSPELEKFSDLQELFKLDPVHDVDSNLGWPKKPQQ